MALILDLIAIGEAKAALVIAKRDERHGFDFHQATVGMPRGSCGDLIVDGVTTMVDCVPDAMANWPALTAEQEYFAFVDDRLICVPGCDADRTRGFVNMEGLEGRVLTLLRV